MTATRTKTRGSAHITLLDVTPPAPEREAGDTVLVYLAIAFVAAAAASIALIPAMVDALL